MADHLHLIQDLELVATTEPRLAALLKRAIEVIKNCSADDTKIPYEGIIAAYNHHLGAYLPRASRCPPSRKAVLRARWLENPEQRTLEWWDKFFARVAASDFLTGRRAPGKGHDNWQPSFDWLTKSANVTKIVEGNYDNRGPRTDIESIERFR